MTQSRAARPWTLNGRKVFAMFLGFFGFIAAVNGLMLYLAVRSWSGAETSSAYRAGQLFSGEIARAHAQDALGWRVTLDVKRGAAGAAEVLVEAKDRDGAPLRSFEARVKLQRPTDQRADREGALVETEPGRYAAALDGVASGQWSVVLDLSDHDERVFRRTARIVLP